MEQDSFTLPGETCGHEGWQLATMAPDGYAHTERMKNKLIGLVYSALLGEITWQHFLDQLALVVPDGRAGLVVHETSSRDGYLVIGGPNDVAADDYNTHFAKLNPLQPALALRDIGDGAFDHELVPRNELVRSEFHNEYLLPLGMSHSCGVKFAQVGTESYVVFSAHGGRTAEPVQRSLGLLRELAPHLARALAHYHSDIHDRATGRLCASLADAADIGVMVINDDKQCRFVSNAANRMMESGACLYFSLDRRVGFRKQRAQAVLESMLKRHYDGRVTVDFNLPSGGRLSLIRVTENSVSTYFEGPTVIALFKSLITPASPSDMQLLSDTYRLSKGEIRALLGIAAGLSAPQIAAQASLSRETIRSQIKSLYAKTGAENRTDILKLVHRRGLAM